MSHAQRGMTLIELVAAAVIGTLVAGGTLVAFVTAIRIHSRTSATDVVFLIQQTLEKYRNHIACDDNLWFNTVTCGMQIACVPNNPNDCFTEDPLPQDPQLTGAIREWRAEAADCDGIGGAGDCLKLTARVVLGH